MSVYNVITEAAFYTILLVLGYAAYRLPESVSFVTAKA